MKNTEEILRKYGLSLFLDELESKSLEDDLFSTSLFLNQGDSTGENELVSGEPKERWHLMELTNERDIMIWDEKRFKEKFEMPERFDDLPNNVFETICVEASEECEMVFYNSYSEEELGWMLIEYVEDHEEDFLDFNKEYQMKKRFYPEGAMQWLVEKLATIVGEVCDSEQFVCKRRQLFEELENALKEDEKEYLRLHKPERIG